MISFKSCALEVTYVISFVIGSVTAYQEQCINGFCFKTPGSDVRRNFDGAKSWCAEESSQLAVVNDSITQQMLTQFLSLVQLNEPAFVNIRLYEHRQLYTWFLVSGPNYYGGVSDQDGKLRDYALYSCLNNSSNGFIVMASNPNQLRSYVCKFHDFRLCSNNSRSSFIFNGSCYIKYESETLTWFKSRERCHDNSGDLATFSYVNDSFTNIYHPPLNTSWLDVSLSYWVGIRWDKWIWKSPECGDEIFYTSWSNGKPNNSDFGCVCVDPNGSPSHSWIDCDCDIPRQFICLKIVTSNSSSVTEARGSSEVMFIALVLGIGVNLPLLIVIVILIVVVIHQRRRIRAKTKNEENATPPETTTREANAMELETGVVEERYAHLRRDTASGQETISKRVYEKIKRTNNNH